MATLQIEICNSAIDLIGQGRRITAFDKSSPEAVVCERIFEPTLKSCLEKFNWGFARRDEIITDDYLLDDVVSLPYQYSYDIPNDVMKVLYITPIQMGSFIETTAHDGSYEFNFRNYDNRKILATNLETNFVMHYQAYVTDLSVISPTFREALEYTLAGKLAPAIIKGVQGVEIGTRFIQLGMQSLAMSADLDAEQGAGAIDTKRKSRFVRSRR